MYHLPSVSPSFRRRSGRLAAAGAAQRAAEDGPEGAQPPAAGALLLQHIPGGSLVSAQRQPRGRARAPQAAAGPEGRPAAGELTALAH